MNADLGNILHQMPAGIMLIDQETNNVKLANSSFFQMLACEDEEDLDQITHKIQEKLFTKYDLQESSDKQTEERSYG